MTGRFLKERINTQGKIGLKLQDTKFRMAFDLADLEVKLSNLWIDASKLER